MSETPVPFEWTLSRIWRSLKSTAKFLGQETMDGEDQVMLFAFFVATVLMLAAFILLVLLTKGWLLIGMAALVLAFDILRLVGRGMA